MRLLAMMPLIVYWNAGPIFRGFEQSVTYIMMIRRGARQACKSLSGADLDGHMPVKTRPYAHMTIMLRPYQYGHTAICPYGNIKLWIAGKSDR